MTLGIYAHVMSHEDGERERLRALVQGGPAVVSLRETVAVRAQRDDPTGPPLHLDAAVQLERFEVPVDGDGAAPTRVAIASAVTPIQGPRWCAHRRSPVAARPTARASAAPGETKSGCPPPGRPRARLGRDGDHVGMVLGLPCFPVSTVPVLKGTADDIRVLLRHRPPSIPPPAYSRRPTASRAWAPLSYSASRCLDPTHEVGDDHGVPVVMEAQRFGRELVEAVKEVVRQEAPQRFRTWARIREAPQGRVSMFSGGFIGSSWTGILLAAGSPP
jgi:hypothetical protein